MKKLLVLFLGALISTPSFAVITPSWYLGLQAGWTDTNYSPRDLDGITSADIDSDGIGGRVLVGYQDNENFAFELGFIYFSTTDVDDIGMVNGPSGEIKQTAVDLSMKVMYPLSYGFSAYGRVGAAYVMPNEDSIINSDLNNEFNVLYGVGMNYDISKRLVLDFSYMRTNGSNGPQDVELASVGLQYHFSI